MFVEYNLVIAFSEAQFQRYNAVCAHLMIDLKMTNTQI